MDVRSALTNIDVWRRELGLLPVPLLSGEATPRRFVLMNGVRGNLCLDVESQDLGATTRSTAWSSNVGHYLVVDDSRVRVQRWDAEPGMVRTFTHDSVRERLYDFYRMLEDESPTLERSVIAHTINVFRRLRAAYSEVAQASSSEADLIFHGTRALKGFLYLLAAATEQVERQRVSLQDWSLDAEAEDAAQALTAGAWSDLYQQLLRGRALEKLKPNLSLMLRHASGLLFQEAHYEATVLKDDQFALDILAPAPVALTGRAAGIGLHFTPPALARTMVEEAILERTRVSGGLPATLTVLDPACGSGEFLREALRQLTLQGYSGDVRLVGFDVSPAACAMARFVLARERRDATAATGVSVDVSIHEVDALSDEAPWPVAPDLVLMNPPFVSWQDMAQPQKEEVKRVLGDMCRGRPDLAAAFIWLAVDRLGEASVIGSVLPASLLDAASYSELRDALGARVSAALIARLGSHQVFHDAQVDAALYIARSGGGGESSPLALWADHRPSSNASALRTLRRMHFVPGAEEGVQEGDGFSIYRNPEIGSTSESWAPRPLRAWRLLQALRSLPRATDIFAVRQGVRTGNNRAFVISRVQWEELPPSEQPYFRTAVMNESIRAGQLDDSLYVFYPHGDAELSTEEALESAVPTYFNDVLLQYKDVLRKRPRIGEQWWLLSEHRAWQRVSQTKLVSTYFGDVGSFAWDEHGEFTVVQGFAWLLPNSDYSPSRNEWLAYLALLNSEMMSELLASVSNNVGGGQWNLSGRFMERLPLPRIGMFGEPTSLDDEDMEYEDLDPANDTLILELAHFGERIHEESLQSLDAGDQRALAELARVAYGPALHP